MPAGDRLRAAGATAATPGAVAVVVLEGPPAVLDAAMPSVVGAGGASLGVGEVRRGSLAGIDDGLVARLSESTAWLMPHGGVRIVARLRGALESLGAEWIDHELLPPRHAWPEATDDLEASVLAAIGRATSPLAVPLLLDQPRRWRGRAATDGVGESDLHERDRRLRRLLVPPTVALLGPPNAGKSTLTNALAGREVAIAHAEPGTTRDFTRTRIDLAGLVVEWLDCPGWRQTADALEREAIELARPAVAAADLVILLAAPGQAWIDAAEVADRPILRVRSKADLSTAPSTEPGVDLRVSATTSAGLRELVERVREALLPASDRSDPRPSKWWTEGDAAGSTTGLRRADR